MGYNKNNRCVVFVKRVSILDRVLLYNRLKKSKRYILKQKKLQKLVNFRKFYLVNYYKFYILPYMLDLRVAKGKIYSHIMSRDKNFFFQVKLIILKLLLLVQRLKIGFETQVFNVFVQFLRIQFFNGVVLKNLLDFPLILNKNYFSNRGLVFKNIGLTQAYSNSILNEGGCKYRLYINSVKNFYFKFSKNKKRIRKVLWYYHKVTARLFAQQKIASLVSSLSGGREAARCGWWYWDACTQFFFKNHYFKKVKWTYSRSKYFWRWNLLQKRLYNDKQMLINRFTCRSIFFKLMRFKVWSRSKLCLARFLKWNYFRGLKTQSVNQQKLHCFSWKLRCLYRNFKVFYCSLLFKNKYQVALRQAKFWMWRRRKGKPARAVRKQIWLFHLAGLGQFEIDRQQKKKYFQQLALKRGQFAQVGHVNRYQEMLVSQSQHRLNLITKISKAGYNRRGKNKIQKKKVSTLDPRYVKGFWYKDIFIPVTDAQQTGFSSSGVKNLNANGYWHKKKFIVFSEKEDKKTEVKAISEVAPKQEKKGFWHKKQFILSSEIGSKKMGAQVAQGFSIPLGKKGYWDKKKFILFSEMVTKKTEANVTPEESTKPEKKKGYWHNKKFKQFSEKEIKKTEVNVIQGGATKSEKKKRYWHNKKVRQFSEKENKKTEVNVTQEESTKPEKKKGYWHNKKFKQFSEKENKKTEVNVTQGGSTKSKKKRGYWHNKKVRQFSEKENKKTEANVTQEESTKPEKKKGYWHNKKFKQFSEKENKKTETKATSAVVMRPVKTGYWHNHTNNKSSSLPQNENVKIVGGKQTREFSTKSITVFGSNTKFCSGFENKRITFSLKSFRAFSTKSKKKGYWHKKKFIPCSEKENKKLEVNEASAVLMKPEKKKWYWHKKKVIPCSEKEDKKLEVNKTRVVSKKLQKNKQTRTLQPGLNGKIKTFKAKTLVVSRFKKQIGWGAWVKLYMQPSLMKCLSGSMFGCKRKSVIKVGVCKTQSRKKNDFWAYNFYRVFVGNGIVGLHKTGIMRKMDVCKGDIQVGVKSGFKGNVNEQQVCTVHKLKRVEKVDGQSQKNNGQVGGKVWSFFSYKLKAKRPKLKRVKKVDEQSQKNNGQVGGKVWYFSSYKLKAKRPKLKRVEKVDGQSQKNNGQVSGKVWSFFSYKLKAKRPKLKRVEKVDGQSQKNNGQVGGKVWSFFSYKLKAKRPKSRVEKKVWRANKNVKVAGISFLKRLVGLVPNTGDIFSVLKRFYLFKEVILKQKRCSIKFVHVPQRWVVEVRKRAQASWKQQGKKMFTKLNLSDQKNYRNLVWWLHCWKTQQLQKNGNLTWKKIHDRTQLPFFRLCKILKQNDLQKNVKVLKFRNRARMLGLYLFPNVNRIGLSFKALQRNRVWLQKLFFNTLAYNLITSPRAGIHSGHFKYRLVMTKNHKKIVIRRIRKVLRQQSRVGQFRFFNKFDKKYQNFVNDRVQLQDVKQIYKRFLQKPRHQSYRRLLSTFLELKFNLFNKQILSKFVTTCKRNRLYKYLYLRVRSYNFDSFSFKRCFLNSKNMLKSKKKRLLIYSKFIKVRLLVILGFLKLTKKSFDKLGIFCQFTKMFMKVLFLKAKIKLFLQKYKLMFVTHFGSRVPCFKKYNGFELSLNQGGQNSVRNYYCGMLLGGVGSWKQSNQRIGSRKSSIRNSSVILFPSRTKDDQIYLHRVREVNEQCLQIDTNLMFKHKATDYVFDSFCVSNEVEKNFLQFLQTKNFKF